MSADKLSAEEFWPKWIEQTHPGWLVRGEVGTRMTRQMWQQFADALASRVSQAERERADANFEAAEKWAEEYRSAMERADIEHAKFLDALKLAQDASATSAKALAEVERLRQELREKNA